ncbi:MAG: hypothetical protein E7523_01700 [Ruminococcaceae bacterium]|nr:hypothetical protein [Oscillospiraceae bacterium]
MKKKIKWLCICFTLILVFIFVFLLCKNNMQANFLSLWTAFQNENTFAIRNHNTDNVYILQTSKKENTFALYRKQDDGTLLRYILSESTITKDITYNKHWQQCSKVLLPAPPYLLMNEIGCLISGREESTNVIRQYTDLLISAFSTVYNDSSLLIDYNTLPSVAQEIASLFKSRDIREKIGSHKNMTATKTIQTVSPFTDPTVSEQVISILSGAIQPQYREKIYAALQQTCNSLNNYSIQITTSFSGSFLCLEVYKNRECVFTVEKLK